MGDPREATCPTPPLLSPPSLSQLSDAVKGEFTPQRPPGAAQPSQASRTQAPARLGCGAAGRNSKAR